MERFFLYLFYFNLFIEGYRLPVCVQSFSYIFKFKCCAIIFVGFAFSSAAAALATYGVVRLDLAPKYSADFVHKPQPPQCSVFAPVGAVELFNLSAFVVCLHGL